MEYFIALFSQRNYSKSLVFFYFRQGQCINYINLMHQIRRIITVAPRHVCRRVLLDVRGIVRVFEVFVKFLGSKLAL